MKFATDGTIWLTNTLNLLADTVLDASGHNVTISGSNAVEIFAVPASVTLVLSNLVLAQGLAAGAGGAISNAGTVQAVLDAGLSRVSERTITSPELLRAELDRVRESGLSYDFEESRPGLVCVASPVHGAGGAVAGALSVSGWSARLKPDRAGPAVRTAALTISRALGARVVAAAPPGPAGREPR